MGIEELQERLGVQFGDRSLLEQALCHRSAAEEGLAPAHNERLEFLGDAVVQLCITELLYRRFGRAAEGDMSRIRARLVNKSFLASLGEGLDLGPLLVLGKGEEKDGRQKASLLADAFEATMGALFLDRGMSACQRVLSEHFEDALSVITDPAGYGRHPKSALQELVMEKWRQTPEYSLLETSGPAHKRRFVFSVSLGERELARGEGHSTKEAQSRAARAALVLLEGELT
ncbi:MAG: ribonuclease-3 [Cognaticolwellia sp.]|jgi:ribonuclease-3